jgi:hypothetical protein
MKALLLTISCHFLVFMFMPGQLVGQMETADSNDLMGLIKIIGGNGLTFQEKESMIDQVLLELDFDAVAIIRGVYGTDLDIVEIRDFLDRLRFGEYGRPENFRVIKKSNALIELWYLDPNRLEVNSDQLFFNPNESQQLEYTVHFQNQSRGLVRNLAIKMQLPENLDESSIQIANLDPALPACPADFDPDTDLLACYQIDKSSGKDDGTILFVIHNIALPGNAGVGLPDQRGPLEGEVVFAVKSNDRKLNSTNVKAEIIFGGAAKPILTTVARTHWRQRVFGLKAAYNHSGNIKDFSRLANNFPRPFYLGVYGENMPVERGFGWGVEAGYDRFQYESLIRTTGELPGEENRLLQYGLLDLSGELFYQFGSNFRMGLVTGLSTLLHGHLSVSAEKTVIIEDMPVLISDEAAIQAGWLIKDIEDQLFDEPLSMRNFSGIFGGMYLETGWLDRVSAGLKYESRYYPRFYDGKSAEHSNFQLFLRVTLFNW